MKISYNLICSPNRTMNALANFMPPLNISTDELKKWGELWLGNRNPETGNAKNFNSFDRHQSVNFASFAEALSLIIWHPETGEIDSSIPDQSSNLRIEKFADILYPHYVNRYKGLPPHD